MFEIRKSRIGNGNLNIRLFKPEGEKFLFDVVNDAKLSIGGYDKDIVRPKYLGMFGGTSYLEQRFQRELYVNFGKDFNNRADRINSIKRQISKDISYLNTFDYSNYNKDSKKLPSGGLSTYTYDELLSGIIHNSYITGFKCNNYYGVIGQGCLILTKIKETPCFIPLVITTVNDESLSYIQLCDYINEKPINTIFNVYVSDLLINSKDADLKNLRIQFKKSILPELEKCNLCIHDLNEFFGIISIPKFGKLSERKTFLDNLSEDVLYSLQGEVVVNY